MSKKYEDFDEWCNPDSPKSVNYEEVVEAAATIKPYVINTPCAVSNYRKEFVMHLYYKQEFLQKTGSVKERGAVNVLQLLSTDKKKIGICLGSIGNAALSICYYAAKFSIPTTAVMTNGTPISVLQKLHSFGTNVIVHGVNLLEAQRHARLLAREKGLTFINGRDHPHMLAGNGTIALEILEQVPQVEAILVPVGTGGLAAAVATIVKKLKPSCLVYGVQSDTTPCFFKSLKEGEPLLSHMEASIANGIAVPIVGFNSFFTAKPLLDKMLLVKEAWIAKAMLHLFEKERYVVEAAGATSLAAVIGHLVPELKTKHVVCILSGGNVNGLLLIRCLERGMAADGRLVKFKVGIKDTSLAKTQLMSLIGSGGYNIVNQLEEHTWISDDNYTCEMNLVVEAENLEHALELKRRIDRAYPCTTFFETEPFNDKRTCPCYVRK